MPGTDERSARVARILALYEQDWTQQAIAHELGISRHEVSKHLDELERLGVINKRSRAAASRTAEQSARAAGKREQAVALRRQLWSVPAIAAELGVSDARVRQYLREGLSVDERRRIEREMHDRHAAAIAVRRERVGVLDQQGWTRHAIAHELGVSSRTVSNDVEWLVMQGIIKKRPPGEAIAAFMRAWWQSEAAHRERIRRFEIRADPVERTCEWCGKHFTLEAWEARWQPGRFCSKKHHYDWKRNGPESAVIVGRLADGYRRWRARVAKLKAECGLLDLDDVTAALPRELRRSQATLSRHMAAGGLVPTPNELGLLLFSETAVAEYAFWLRSHPSSRLQNFNATTADRVRFRGRWYEARHKSEAEFGRLASVINKPGPKRGRLPPETEAEIRQRLEDGRSLAEIVADFDGEVTIMQVRRVRRLAKEAKGGI
jgi:predicted transcriptional regulator